MIYLKVNTLFMHDLPFLIQVILLPPFCHVILHWITFSSVLQ